MIESMVLPPPPHPSPHLVSPVSGQDQGWPCNAAWQFGKHSLVSRDHAKFNMSRETSATYRNQTTWRETDRAKQVAKFSKIELEGLREFVAQNMDAFDRAELEKINRRFVLHGLPQVL